MQICQCITDDIVQAASMFNVPISAEVIKDTVALFEKPFFLPSKKSFIQFRVAKKSSTHSHYVHELNWRSEVLIETIEDAKSLLSQVQSKLHHSFSSFTPSSNKVDHSCLIEELCNTFPTRSIALDFGPTKGLSKIWHFGRCNVSAMLNLVHISPFVKNYENFFKKYDFHKVYSCGIDLEKESMNIYFMFTETRGKSQEDVLQILEQFNFVKPPSVEILSFIANFCTAFAMTFSWTEETVERICFYCARDGPASFAKEFPQFVSNPLPSREKSPKSFVGCSFGKEFYTKLETDYFNHYYEFLDKMIDFNLEDD